MSAGQEPCPCEVDHLIPLDLGGSNALTNLWPQPHAISATQHWDSIQKDRLEKRLHQDVCKGLIDLDTAQREISTDWTAAFVKTFGAPKPNGNGTNPVHPQ
jgi:hypothetical protein